MVDVIVPTLGESIAEASVAKINKKIGDYVKVDEVLFELETDKATMEINSPCSGVIKEIKFKEGDEVAIKSVLAIIDESAESGASATSNKQQITPALQNAPVKAHQEKVQTHSPAIDYSKQDSPAAKLLMENHNIDRELVPSSGKDGRITKSDILQYQNDAVAVLEEKPANAVKGERIVLMSKLRQRIAQRLKESQNTAAMLTTFNEVDLYNVMKIRGQYKDLFEKKHGVKLGFMSFFVKAAIAALSEFQEINAEIRGTNIVYKENYHIGVAVSSPNGLVVPVIRCAENLSIAEIEKEILNFSKKAKENKLSPQDMQGGSFTISNGGVFGSLMSTPIINPPQSGILGMHAIKERPVVVNGEIKIRPMMYLALSYDHRIVDGKEAVTFLVRVRDYIENPERLILDV